ncbi:MAG: hypothetical protein Q8880_11325 [Bacteroidota bacterium]|nr:hypothetical protein [Bacteroidota bacterium]
MTFSNYEILIKKLDEFIRKYYKNQLIRGGIYLTAVLVAFFIIIAVSEYFAHFGTAVRTFMFYSYIAINTFILIRQVVIPLLGLWRIGKVISHEEAARIIGKYFRNVKDKLLNTLQLKQLAENNIDNKFLIEASINQKIEELKPIPFSSAISLKENRKYLKYAVIPMILMVLLLFSAPKVLTEPGKRLISHDVYFEKPLPFHFVIQNKNLNVVQNDDYTLHLKLTGNEIPDNVYMNIDNSQYKLSKENTISFSYVFKNVNQNKKFYFEAAGYRSADYELNVYPKPIVLNFSVQLDYPAYLNKPSEVISNTGDLVLPAGTRATWKFNTKDTKYLNMIFDHKTNILNNKDENNFTYSKVFLENETYAVTTINEYLRNRDSLFFSVNVVPDAYPAIETECKKDTVSNQRLYFSGNISDDYGFSKLTFNYRLTASEDKENRNSKMISIDIPISKTIVKQPFYYYFDINNLNLSFGDEIEYYFEVSDNDGIRGPKSTRSVKEIFKTPTIKELEKKAGEKSEDIKKQLSQAMKDAKELQNMVDDLNRRMVDKKNLTWEDKNKIQQLIEKQKNLQSRIENLKKENLIKNRIDSQISPNDEDIVQKQEQLQDLFDKIMTDEMKELFKELEKMMEKVDKQSLQDKVDKMKLDNKDLQKELDRSLSLYKQLEFEQNLDRTIKKIDELSQKQKDLSQESQKKDADSKELSKKQDDLSNKYQDVKKDINNLKEENRKLEQPVKFGDTNLKEAEIQNKIDEASKQLKDRKPKKASKPQEEAAEGMQQLEEKLNEVQKNMEENSMAEDYESLRLILQNLLRLSFGQENLMLSLTKTNTNNPYYVKIIQKQKQLKDDAKMIEDSLFALSKRQIQIKSVVNKEISAINNNMDNAIEMLAKRQPYYVTSRQQYSMTAINNLALILNESLDDFHKEMSKNEQKKPKSGSGSCNKPGGNGKSSKKPSLKTMKKLQEELNKQLQKLKEEQGKGQCNKPKGNKPCKDGSGKQFSEQFARYAAQQEAIRRQLNALKEQLKKEGKFSDKNLEKISQEMEQTETELVNKKISMETLLRQQDIFTRLLESEKAEKERDMEERRESNEAKSEKYSNPSEFLEYKRLKSKQAELLKTMPVSFKMFYKNKVGEYLNNLEK